MAARRIPSTPSPEDGTPSAMRHCERTSISEPCKSSVRNSALQAVSLELRTLQPFHPIGAKGARRRALGRRLPDACARTERNDHTPRSPAGKHSIGQITASRHVADRKSLDQEKPAFIGKRPKRYQTEHPIGRNAKAPDVFPFREPDHHGA